MAGTAQATADALAALLQSFTNFSGGGGGAGGGGAGGGAAPDPADESYQNSYSTINALMGNPLPGAFAYAEKYSFALDFQMQLEQLYDQEITAASGVFVMANHLACTSRPVAIADMDFHNVTFIMTLCEWAGLAGVKEGSVHDDHDIWLALRDPMSSEHMKTYCKHLHNLYTCIIIAPDRDEVVTLCPANEGLYNENSQGMCSLRTMLKMMEVASKGGYSYSDAVATLMHEKGFGRCLFRSGSSSRMLRA